MAELNIKKEIGKRIHEARKAKGLTLKALGAITGGLKQTRLTNWEQGTRAPGPEEIKQLAIALDVSPAFLMCLSDEVQFKKTKNHSQLIPLLNHQQASEKLHGNLVSEESQLDDVPLLSISTELLPDLSADAFALRMTDESMTPEIRINDVLVVDPSLLPEPGDFVAVKIKGKAEAIICQYKKLSYTTSEFGLMTLNDKWPDITVSENDNVEIIGKVVQNVRGYK